MSVGVATKRGTGTGAGVDFCRVSLRVLPEAEPTNSIAGGQSTSIFSLRTGLMPAPEVWAGNTAGSSAVKFTAALLHSNIVSIHGSSAEDGSPAAKLTTSAAARTGFLSRFTSPLMIKAASVMTALGLLAQETKAAWMKTANYTNLTTRQQHADLGMSYCGTVVHLMWGDTWRGSGVVVNNPRCLVMAAHQFEDAGAFLNPATENLYIRTGPNYVTDPGSSVRISQIIFHPLRTAPGVGKDVAIAILESDLPGAIPATIATVQPTSSQILSIVGFGNQGSASVSSWGYIVPTSHDIWGGNAPVNANDGATIKTSFIANSTVPLIYNSTPGDSGGGLFNSERKLCGTISNGSANPSSTANTYSVNLITINPWIQQTTSPYNIPIAPTLQMQMNAGQITITAVGAALQQYGGNWILRKSNNLVDWTDVQEPFVGNAVTMFTNEPREYYRLDYVPPPQGAMLLQDAQEPQVEANFKQSPKIVLPRTNNLLLPRNQ